MKRTMRLAVLAAGALAAGGAAGDKENVAGSLIGGGFVAALLALLGLSVGLAVHAFRRDWIAAQMRAIDRSTTACFLSGAGLVVATVFAVALLAPRALPLAWIVLAAATTWFFVGFAACARRQGERMLGAAPNDPSVRPLVLGWLARAGLFAVPVAWPFIAVYLVVLAYGAPLVALFDRPEPPTS